MQEGEQGESTHSALTGTPQAILHDAVAEEGGDLLVQQATGSKQAPLDRRLGQAKETGDVSLFAAFDIKQNDDAPVVDGKAVEGLPDDIEPLITLQLLVRPQGC